MARHPEWFARLEAIEDTLRQSPAPALGRPEIRAVFAVSDRDAIRLLHRFGGERQADALSIPRSAVLAQLSAVKEGNAYQTFLRPLWCNVRKRAVRLPDFRNFGSGGQYSIPKFRHCG